jgi:hypothetical protein
MFGAAQSPAMSAIVSCCDIVDGIVITGPNVSVRYAAQVTQPSADRNLKPA